MSEFKFIKLKPTQCPSCKQELDAGATANENSTAPKPGDPSVCMNCGEMLIFKDDMELRVLELSDAPRIPPGIVLQMIECQNHVRSKPPEKPREKLRYKPED